MKQTLAQFLGLKKNIVALLGVVILVGLGEEMGERFLPRYLDRRTMGVSVHSLVRRIPMALGPVIGGLLIGWYGMENGVRLAFAAPISCTLFPILFQL